MKTTGEALWVRLLGDDTNVGTMRFMGFIAVFVLAGGFLSWLLI